MKDTKESSYTEHLEKSTTGYRSFIDVQWPYRKHLEKLNLKQVLDIGCGIGRNLDNLKKIGTPGIGVDHNAHSIEVARKRGFEAYSIDEFKQKFRPDQKSFSSILVAHVLEHMTSQEAVELLQFYLPYLKEDGQVIIITPQEAGYRSDPTHREFLDIEKTRDIIEQAGLAYVDGYSFPFPRFFGRFFPYNEFVSLGKK